MFAGHLSDICNKAVFPSASEEERARAIIRNYSDNNTELLSNAPEESLELLGVVSGNEEMVVGNGVGEQVRDDVACLEPYLRATEVRLVLVACERDILRKDTGKVAVHFHQCVVAKRQVGVQGDTDARLEMRLVLVTLCHIQRNGAVRPQHLARIRVHAGRVALETRTARQSVCQHHGQQGGNIALAGSRDTLCIEFRQCQATRVLDRGEQVETTEGKSCKLISINHFAQAVVYAECTRFAVFHLPERCYFADVYFHLFAIETGANNLHIVVGSDEPIARFTDES